MTIVELHNLIKAVCPIEGINSDGLISFAPEATNEQKSLAQTAMGESLSLLDGA